MKCGLKAGYILAGAKILCEKNPRFGELKVYVIPANSSKRRW